MRKNPQEKKRRVLVIRNAYSYDFGGGERMAVELAHELAKHNLSVLLVSSSKKILAHANSRKIDALKGPWWSFQDWSGKFLIFLPVYVLWQCFLFCWYLALILRLRIDVVHPQSRDDFIAATIAGKLLRKPVVWTDHADLKYVYMNGSVWYKNPVGKFIYWLSRFAKAVVLVSKNEKQEIEQSLNRKLPSNYMVIYNGVSSAEIEPKVRPAKYKDAVIFTATSRLVMAKGIGELIEAFKKVASKNSNAFLWLFGEGPDMEIFQQAANENEKIIFWGYPQDSLNRLADCDVFVHPSYHEGFSISLIEAAKLGLPIVACAVGGNPEIVSEGKNGLLVNSRDPSSLAQALDVLLKDSDLRHKYGAAGRKIYEDNFIWENIVKENYLGFYA